MSNCVTLRDIAKLTVEEAENVAKSAESYNSSRDCQSFHNQVRSLESSVVQSYKIAVHLVKQTTDLGEITETWKIASEICDSVLKVMKSLKNSDPDCGTAQVYDLTLDYKNAAFKRYKLALEEREWEKKEIPAGLFPKTS